MKYALLAAVAASGLLVGQANAGTISYTGVSYPTDETVTLTDNALGVNETVYAGQFSLLGVVQDGTTPLDSFYAWCVDITHNLMSNATYNSGQSPAVVGLTDQTKINQISQIIRNYVPSGDFTSAATQVAIWEIEYGSDLQVTGNDPIKAAASDLITLTTKPGSPYYGPVDGYSLKILDRGDTTNQDLAYLDPTNVPEPASLAVLGAGLLGIVMIRRRGQKTADCVTV